MPEIVEAEIRYAGVVPSRILDALPLRDARNVAAPLISEQECFGIVRNEFSEVDPEL